MASRIFSAFQHFPGLCSQTMGTPTELPFQKQCGRSSPFINREENLAVQGSFHIPANTPPHPAQKHFSEMTQNTPAIMCSAVASQQCCMVFLFSLWKEKLTKLPNLQSSLHKVVKVWYWGAHKCIYSNGTHPKSECSFLPLKLPGQPRSSSRKG